jgi:hypothetical protein
MRYLVALLMLAWPLAAAAQPRSIADCEKVKGDLAYNQCLASFGPSVKSGATRSSAGEIDPGDGAQAQEPQRGGMLQGGRGSYGRQIIRKPGGRQSMSFDIVNSGSEVKPAERTRSSDRSSRRRR